MKNVMKIFGNILIVTVTAIAFFLDHKHGPGRMPCEAQFANSFEDTQLDVERREKKYK